MSRDVVSAHPVAAAETFFFDYSFSFERRRGSSLLIDCTAFFFAILS